MIQGGLGRNTLAVLGGEAAEASRAARAFFGTNRTVRSRASMADPVFEEVPECTDLTLHSRGPLPIHLAMKNQGNIRITASAFAENRIKAIETLSFRRTVAAILVVRTTHHHGAQRKDNPNTQHYNLPWLFIFSMEIPALNFNAD